MATLSPIGLRPHSPLPVQAERAGAFILLGGLFALAYPRHIVWVALIVFGSALLLELLQVLAPSRHGRVFDLLVKLAGGGIGLGLGWALGHWTAFRSAPR